MGYGMFAFTALGYSYFTYGALADLYARSPGESHPPPPQGNRVKESCGDETCEWLSPRHTMRVFGQCRRRRLVTCLMTVRTSVPLGVRAGRRIATTGVPLAT
jgi:hypothetical protein